MSLVNMRDMLNHAYENGYAVGAFDLVSLDFLEGIMDAAEHCDAPVILSLAESHFTYFDFELIMSAVVAAAKRATIPVAIHLDHGESFESAVQGINLGCNGIMIDSSQQTLTENINLTRRIVEMAHSCGVPVEGELGYVPGVEGEDAERHPGEIADTTVAEAKVYLEQTNVDFLAVSIGTVHGRMQGKAKLDYLRLQQINDALGIPLVIHGGTGLSDEQYQQLINCGVSKINYYTSLADVAGLRIRENTQSNPLNGYTGLADGVKETISTEVERCIKLWGSAEHAKGVLAKSKVWSPVEHLIIYNVHGITKDETLAMIEEGKTILSTIPGVLEIVTGHSIQDDDSYRYTWLIRFCHQAVIESYRNHHLHVAFADTLFRPVAGERISIDYQIH
ncbi:MAG: class II fructose-bisphosphate aldolase [Gammaproteobacteria bacterium]